MKPLGFVKIGEVSQSDEAVGYVALADKWRNTLRAKNYSLDDYSTTLLAFEDVVMRRTLTECARELELEIARAT